MKFKGFTSWIFLLVILCLVNVVSAEPVLQPWNKNPWYWSDHGEPVLLLGGSDDDSLFQWPEKDLLVQLDRLVAAGGNVIRNTMSSRQDRGFEVFPFKQLNDGKYDLEQWNDEYWARFDRMLRETAKRGIVVQIEVWDPWDYMGDTWHIQPYNPRNNIAYTMENSELAERYPEPPYLNKQPFFFTTPRQQNNRMVLRYQQRFVDKMLDYTLRYGHVLYCMDNETNGEEEWSRYWATYLKQRADREDKRIFVTEMWGNKDVTAEIHRRTFDHPEVYDFVDVSQNNHQSGQNHWDQFLRTRRYLAEHPRPINTTKTYGATGNRFGNDQDGIERFWRNLLAGAASIRFHRPTAGLGLNDKAVASIRGARKLESQIPLWTLEPANDLLINTKPNHAYLAADRSHAFALYLPVGGRVGIDLSNTTEPLVVRWIEIATGEWGPEQHIQGGGKTYLTSPGLDNWAAAFTPERPGKTD
ncbi:hypothetical protein [Candidatus Nitrospira allomarina]|uniref:Uncharacterized protein n=1 Tax=Candidatus Nitrospira allomarina TaxID=3020900 RepID=A0AA96G8I4_9BACT|nr:hypothetical protein [Candidatus Nitrospira allomarina]WNM56717.1 hypothetical protein PP769_12085 [Candidatus Nitrospira allomarina]